MGKSYTMKALDTTKGIQSRINVTRAMDNQGRDNVNMTHFGMARLSVPKVSCVQANTVWTVCCCVCKILTFTAQK